MHFLWSSADELQTGSYQVFFSLVGYEQLLRAVSLNWTLPPKEDWGGIWKGTILAIDWGQEETGLLPNQMKILLLTP